MGLFGGSGRREAQTSAWTWGVFHSALAASAVLTAVVVVVMLAPGSPEARWARGRVETQLISAVGCVVLLGGLVVRASRAMAYECSIRRGPIPDLVAGSWLLAVPALAVAAAAARARGGAGEVVGLLALYLAWSWGASVVAFMTYAADKYVAIERGRGRPLFGRRTPEKVLQSFALFGGAPGAVLAQRVLHHKTSIEKRGFRTMVWVQAGVHYVAVAVVAYLYAR